MPSFISQLWPRQERNQTLVCREQWRCLGCWRHASTLVGGATDVPQPGGQAASALEDYAFRAESAEASEVWRARLQGHCSAAKPANAVLGAGPSPPADPPATPMCISCPLLAGTPHESDTDEGKHPEPPDEELAKLSAWTVISLLASLSDSRPTSSRAAARLTRRLLELHGEDPSDAEEYLPHLCNLALDQQLGGAMPRGNVLQDVVL